MERLFQPGVSGFCLVEWEDLEEQKPKSDASSSANDPRPSKQMKLNREEIRGEGEDLWENHVNTWSNNLCLITIYRYHFLGSGSQEDERFRTDEEIVLTDADQELEQLRDCPKDREELDKVNLGEK